MAEWYDQMERTIREHVAASNERDLPHLLGGLAQEIIWQTGQDTFRGRDELAEVFSDAFRTIAPTLTETGA
jgi:ketosteroid isomerase-like protein